MKKKNILVGLCCSLLLSACSLDYENVEAITPDAVWKDSKMINAFLNNIYGNMMPGWPITANNTDEVVVQVNKGMYWAVAKVKVREKVTDYFNQVYSNGQDIVVGEPDNENGYGLKINNTDFSGGQLLQDAASISDNNGVYFIEDGATVTLDAISDLQSLVIVGNNPEKPSTVKVEANSFLLGATGGKGIVMKNVILDAENATFTNGGLIATTAGSVYTQFYHIIFEFFK